MRQCLFCHRAATSREHILPNWLLEHFRQTKRRIVLTFDLEGLHKKGISITPGMRVKFVCDDCNHGWMSDLETAVKPLLGSMLHDVTLRIDGTQQSAIARWAIKTTMVMESIANRVHPFFERDERERLHSSLAIPPNTYVWLARSVGEYDLAYVGMHLWNEKPGDPKAIHCYVNSIGFGYLVLQVFSAHIPDGHPRMDVPTVFSAPWEKLLIQIWPTTERFLAWPPEMTFSDTGMITFGDLVNRFRPRDAALV